MLRIQKLAKIKFSIKDKNSVSNTVKRILKNTTN